MGKRHGFELRGSKELNQKRKVNDMSVVTCIYSSTFSENSLRMVPDETLQPAWR